MKKMFINFSNHPSQNWSSRQVEAAKEYGEIVDLPFPDVAPNASEKELQVLADEYVQKIQALAAEQQPTVHVMGEMTLVFLIVSQLKALGVKCVASTTKRTVTENQDGTKLSEFAFVRFREY